MMPVSACVTGSITCEHLSEHDYICFQYLDEVLALNASTFYYSVGRSMHTVTRPYDLCMSYVTVALDASCLLLSWH